MEASVGMVIGSHKQNELVGIHRDGELGYVFSLPTTCLVELFSSSLVTWCLVFLLLLQPKPMHNQSGQVCQICGSNVGLTLNSELFIAYNECAFPICQD
jgi:hypothetical protein